MISILYPEGDFTAADLSIKLQALAQDQAGQIFIVPKHVGRNEENVYKNLKRTKTAIFLSHDKYSIDQATKGELDYLVKNRAKIYAIVPRHAKKSLPPEVSTHPYDQKQPGHFLETVKRIVTELENQKQASGAEFGVLLVVLAFIILIVAAFDNGKK